VGIIRIDCINGQNNPISVFAAKLPVYSYLFPAIYHIIISQRTPVVPIVFYRAFSGKENGQG